MPPFAPLPAARAAAIRDLLQDRKVRAIERAFVLEAVKPILELLDRDSPLLLSLIVTQEFLDRAEPAVLAKLERAAARVSLCPERAYRKLSDLTSAPGLLAVVRSPARDESKILKRPRLLGLYGEGLQDPANVGAIIRTALAFEADALWLSPDSADPLGPKVVRATAGAVASLPLFQAADASRFVEQGCAILAAVPAGKGGRSLREIIEVPRRAIVAFGNESRGLSEGTLNRATVRFHIPVSGKVDSLNVAASAAIALFHFRGLAAGKERERQGEGSV